MLQITLHLTQPSRLWTLLLLELEILLLQLLRSEKKDTLTFCMKIHKGVIFDSSKINNIVFIASTKIKTRLVED
jgi:hypothetical protein